jgi:hypothetical protein
MKLEKRYFTHTELCELLEVPEDSALAIPEDGFRYDVLAEMWMLEMNVGTPAEIEELMI